MGNTGLLGIFEDLASAHLDAQACRDAVSWLANRLCTRTGAIVAAISITSSSETGTPGESTRVVVIAPPGADSRLTDMHVAAVADLAAVGQGEPVSHVHVRGPSRLASLDIADSEQAIAIQMRFDFAVCTVLVIIGMHTPIELPLWLNVIPACLRLVLLSLDDYSHWTLRGPRHSFYKALFSSEPRDPDTDLGKLCQAWCVLGCAQAAWLWLHNDYTDTFCLQAFAAATSAHPLIPRDLTPGKTSIASFVLATNQPVYVEDLATWTQIHDGITYRVECSEQVKAMGCPSALVVPIVAPPSADATAPAKARIRGAISLHYQSSLPPHQQPSSSLLLMGQESAQFIVNSFLAEQHALLVTLNEMVHSYLARSGRPQEIRADYLGQVIRLIQKRLHVKAVSVFYRQQFGDGIECLATTGLRRSDGSAVSYARPSEAVYAANEGRTGRCFATGQPLVYPQTAAEKSRQFKFIEVNPETGADAQCAAIYPILAPSSRSPAMPHAIGVIRCADHRSPHFHHSQPPFHSFHLQTLGFLAQQIGPVLQTFQSRIEREHTIRILKHDLHAPMSMIKRTVEKVSEAIQENQPVQPYDLANLQVSHKLATNLVQQLDPNPDLTAEVRPTRTLLEGDIVARLTNMLGHFASVERRMKIEYRNLREIPPLKIDRDLVERALQNLIMNAIKYGNPGSTIDIEGRRASDGFHVYVSNYGIGIDAEDEPHIFEPNYRSRAAAKRALGLGLGLPIARAAMEHHGGRLDLLRTANPTTFAMFFPEYLISRSVEEDAEFSPEPSFLDESILSPVLLVLGHQATAKKAIKVVRRHVRTIPALTIDRAAISRAFTNVMQIAIAHGKPESTVVIEGRQHRDGFMLETHVTGLQLEEHEEGAEAGGVHRSDVVRTIQGKPLNVATARHAMDLHRGQVVVSAAPRGAVLSLVFPRSLVYRGK